MIGRDLPIWRGGKSPGGGAPWFFLTRMIAASRSALTARPPIFGIAMTLLVCCKARGSAFWSSEWDFFDAGYQGPKMAGGVARGGIWKIYNVKRSNAAKFSNSHVQQTGFCALCNGCGSSLGGHDIKVQRWSIRRDG